MNFRKIAKAWGKHLSGEPLTEEQLERVKICATCPLKSFKTNIDVFANDDVEQISGYICDSNKMGLNEITGEITKGCSCYLPAKVRDNDSKCPLGKW